METAYKAVMKPKEGTILTVAREAAAKAAELAEKQKIWMHFSRRDLRMQRKLLPDTGDAAGSERSRSSGFRWTGTSGSMPWCI